MKTSAVLTALYAAGDISGEITLDCDDARSIALRIVGDDAAKIIDQANGAYLHGLVDSLAHAGQIVALDLLDEPLDTPRTGREEETLLDLFTAIRIIGGIASGLQRYERELRMRSAAAADSQT